jgi:putative methyltransferase (TIGR04325 family)
VNAVVNSGLKRWIGDWVPPHVRRLVRGGSGDQAVRYSGNFASWNDARRASQGYDAPAILERVKQATLKVQRGEAAYERDSVVFDRIEHSYPLLVGLLRTALRNDGRLNVLDIGGSLGSTFYQCRQALEPAAKIQWSVLEQPSFASCGREHFQTEQLRFFDDLEACLRSQCHDVAVLSSVLPYVEEPHTLLETIAHSVPAVIIDRTPVWSERPDCISVEHVPASIYGFATSYPAWVFNRQSLLAHFAGRFCARFEFGALAGRIEVDGTSALDTGWLFELSTT